MIKNNINKPKDENEFLVSEIERLRERLEEAEDIIDAIRGGRVDALVAPGTEGDRIYTLEGADQSYRFMIETMNEGAVVLSESGTILYCNRRFGELLGLPIQTVIGGSILDLVNAADKDRFTDLQNRAFQEVEGNAEIRFMTGEGNVVPTLVSMRNFTYAEFNAVCVVITNLTELKQTENVLEAVRRNEERFREAFEHAPIGMTLNDLDGRFVHVNDAYCRMVGYSREELINKGFRFQDINYPEDTENNINELNRLLRGEIPAFFVEKRYVRKDGHIIWVRANVTLRKDDAGKPIQIVGLIEDITPRKETEEQLRQAQKMEAVGRLAGGVAHEFNNMLNVIIGYADLLNSRLDHKSGLHHFVEEIQKAARRSAEMTGQLLAYSRKQMVAPRVVNLTAQIEKQKMFLNRLIGEGVDILFNPGDDVWPVRIDPSQVDQVLANLAINARDAIPGSGLVVIGIENVRITSSNALPDLPPGDYVCLTFADTGTGMEKDTLDRIFEPYFTTKEVGKGTGLGLSMVYGIVKQNDGSIYVESEPGSGTTFTLYFPRSFAEADTEEIADAENVRPGGETVLVVEDETQVLHLAEIILTDSGYKVLKAKRPGEAIDIARQHTGVIDLLLSDVVMPGMNSKALQSFIEEIKPGIRTVFMSGYTDDIIAEEKLGGPAVDLIRKPFTARALTEKVREVLDR